MKNYTSSKKSDNIPYVKNMLDGVSYVDPKSAIMMMKGAISTDAWDRNSPYAVIRKFIKYFDPTNGIIRHGRKGTSTVLQAINTNNGLRRKITFLTAKDSELITLLYEQKIYKGYELVERVSWKLQDIAELVEAISNELNKSGILDRFKDYEAIKGSSDGRILGLRSLCLRSVKKLGEIEAFIQRLNQIAKNGKDPLLYY